MSDAISSFGTLLKVGDGGTPESFTAIAEVRDIKPPKLSQDTEDITTQSSPGAWREHLPTLKDGGEVTFDINYIPTETTHDATTGLIKDFEDQVLRNYQCVFSDVGETTWSFAAYVTGFEPDAPVAGVLRASVTFKVSGQPTLA